MHVRTGFTISELATALAAVGVLAALLLPVLHQKHRNASVQQSLDNLTVLGIAHHIYAADWNGRQYTQIVDEISAYGDAAGQAFAVYHTANGGCPSAGAPGCHPPILLGWGANSGLWAFWMNISSNWAIPQPIVFTGVSEGFGSFRISNAKGFHDYIGGRFFAPEFYAPDDVVPYEIVEPFFEDPSEFPVQPSGDIPWSSYCNSPAAMFDPQVMRHPDDGGWQDPWSIDEGMTSPSLSEATYPSLKTQMIEHHWNQNAPADPCNPEFDGGTFDGCEPYYFNHSMTSEPGALFYDLTVRLLPVSEAVAADAQVMAATGHGLWSRDTPFGADGYFSDVAYDLTQTSFHVLTTEGIHGRDTLEGAGAGAGAPGKPTLKQATKAAAAKSP